MKHRLGVVSALAFLLFSARGLWGIDVYLARIPIIDETGNPSPGAEKPYEDLLQAISAALTGDAVKINGVEDSPASSPLSFLDAARLCQNNEYPYLLYGYLKKSEYSYSAEVKLLERGKNELSAVFFAGDDRDHYERLLADIAAKIKSFFYADAGLAVTEKEKAAEKGLLNLQASLGYWAPLANEWSGMLSGLASAACGVRFIPVRPLFGSGSRSGYVALGSDLEYAIGMNDPSYESYVFNTLKVRLPVEAILDMGGGHSFGFGIGLLFQFDLLFQTRNYTDPYMGITAGVGASFSASYRFRLSDFLALGLSTLLDITGYDPALVVFSPRIFLDFALWNLAKEKGDE
jgi:hypothetical protein